MNRFFILFPVLCSLVFTDNVSAQIVQNSSTMKFTGRIQNLGLVEMQGDAVETNLLVRRARLKFEGVAINPKFQYKVELGLTNRDHGSPIPQTQNSARMILDAVVQYEIGVNTHLWFGQTKLPGNRERVISSAKLQFVDRSLLNSNYNIDRDMGLQLHQKFGIGTMKAKAIVSVSQGEGRNITTGNLGGFDYTGRLELLPLGAFTSKGDYFGSDLKREETPKLALGLSYDYHDNASKARGNTGSFLSQTRTLSTIFADMMFKYKGFSVMAEYAIKSSDESPVFADASGLEYHFVTGSALNIQAGYLLQSDWELAARFTSVTPEAVLPQEDVSMYTLGISKYIDGHNLKVQSDFSMILEGDMEQSYLARLQFELSFN
ncbi:MAG: porin [Bacteroidetes bacterium]|nr:porin [Bacteroidota bacterium]MDA0980726.1 porin [Bacteroidota bacterium]